MAKKKTGETGVAKSARTKAIKKKTAKKAGDKKSTRKAKGAASSPKKARSRKAKSIDSVIREFDSERVAQNSNLDAIQKQIQRTTAQISSLKAELAKLYQRESETTVAIETLDSRRDHEIGSLLTSLGINLDNAAAAAKKKSREDLGTPLFPEDSDLKDSTQN